MDLMRALLPPKRRDEKSGESMSTTTEQPTELECLCDQGVECPIETHEAALKPTAIWEFDQTQKALAKQLHQTH